MLGKYSVGPAPFDPEEAPIDCRRASPRLNQRGRAAAVFRGSAKIDLLVLNLSRNGIMAECKAPPAVGEHVGIALDGGNPTHATTLWAQGRRFGARFASALPFEALWPPAVAYRAAQPIRAGADRIVVDVLAMVRLDGIAAPGRIRNVSVRGMLVETAMPLPPGHLVEIEVDGWMRRGMVMWSHDGNAGVHLDQPLTEVQMLGLKLSRRVPAD